MYLLAPCHDRSIKDIEGDENVVLRQNNNVFDHLNDKNDIIVGDDNDDNNNNDKNDGPIALIIRNIPPYASI